MHLTSITYFTAWLAVVTASGPNLGIAKRQDGPVDPGVAEDCVSFDTALDTSPTTVKTTTAAATARSTITAPSPTQAGLIASCTTFYKAVQGDSCWDIVNVKYAGASITLENFYAWNPAVGTDCHSLLAGYHYCVSVSGGDNTTTTTKKTTTTTKTTTAKTPATTIKATSTTKTTTSTTTTKTPTTTIKTTSTTKTTTPTTMKTTTTAKAPTMTGTSTKKTTTTTTTTTTTKTSSSSTTAPTPTSCTSKAQPTPTQPGTLCTCKKWHLVKSGDTCEKLQTQYDATEADFLKWNPGVGGMACSSLWAGYNVCVGV